MVLLNAHHRNDIEDQYLDPVELKQLTPFMRAHLAMSVVLLINFALGSAMVTINRGLSWKRNIQTGAIVLNASAAVENMFNIADTVLPNYIWAAIFLAMDIQTWYYCLFVLMSV